MSLLEQQNFLARIYTDENLRRAFADAPERIGRENDLTQTEINELAEILPAELNSFAESLFWKRLREVEKLLPLTREKMGEEFEKHFRRFAASFNPQSIKKHLEDSFRFCEYLKKNNSVSELVKNAAKFEQSKLEFWGFGKSFVVRLFSYDAKTDRKRKHLKIWLRIGKREIIL